MVEPDEEAWEEHNGFIFNEEGEDLGSICGHVFEDVNKNNKWNKNKDKGLGGVKIKVTAENGDVLYATTDEDGWYTVENVPAGNASVKIVRSTLPDPDNAELVVGSDPTPVMVEPDEEAWEEHNGYIFDKNEGPVTVFVYEDHDANGAYDSNNTMDKPIPNHSVVITDSEGVEHHFQTDSNGYVNALLPLGSVTISIDDVEGHDLIEGDGENPTTIENTTDEEHINYGFSYKGP